MAPRDPDATPVEGIGTLRLVADQIRGNDDETREICPRCEGRGELEHRTESAQGYRVTYQTCWLCDGACTVSLRAGAEFRRIQGSK